jgi:two-component system response regulator NreC
MELKLLIIDDHSLLIDGYKAILSTNSFGYNFTVAEANNCEIAYKIITNLGATPFDVVFIDIKLPPFNEQKIYSGEDLALLVRKQLPSTKIIILTSHDEAFVLQKIIANINPEGLLVKSDFTSAEFLTALNKIIEGEHYYSSSVKKLEFKKLSKNKLFDNYNIQIIMLLDKGIKTKNLQEYLHLSASAIDKRKSAIKTYFGIEKGTDEDIIREARKQGLI